MKNTQTQLSEDDLIRAYQDGWVAYEAGSSDPKSNIKLYTMQHRSWIAGWNDALTYAKKRAEKTLLTSPIPTLD